MAEETRNQACEDERAREEEGAPGAAPAPDLCAAIESCASVLGAVLGQDPRDPAARAVIDGLAVLDLTAEWPLGDDAELARAQDLPSVLGAVLGQDPRDPAARAVIDGLAVLDLTAEWPLGDDAELARAQDLLRAGAAAPSDELREEYKRQFVGPAHFEAPQWASVYLDPDEVVFGNAHLELLQWAPSDELREEYKRQFVGPAHFEAPQWASVYLDPDEVVFGNAHLELLQWMRANGIEGQDDPQAGRMPCDSAARELSLLAWLAANRPELMAPFVADHLMTWLPRYLDLLEETSRQPFWQGAAVLTRATAWAAANALGARPPKRQLFH